jgi:hypothetical protein
LAYKEIEDVCPFIQDLQDNLAFGRIKFKATDTAPLNPKEGWMYGDDSEGVPKYYSGSTWISLASSTVSVSLPAFTAATTVYAPIMAVPTDITIDKIYLAARVVPADADGTCTVRVVNYDTSGTPADDEIVAAWDAEGLTAKTSTSLTVITTGGVNAIEAGDFLFVELTNNSAGIDTNWADAIITVEYHYT